MKFLDNENDIIEMFQCIEHSSVYFPFEKNEIVQIFESIYNEEKWNQWTYSAGKADLTPDFYSINFEFMMEVMRVDDHTYKNKKGKLVNPTNAQESKLIKEIIESNISLNMNFAINARTNLTTDKDHNYSFYKKNFTRVINKHNEQVSTYRINHPGYKLVFFIMDESSAYFEVYEERDINKSRNVGEIFGIGKPHFWFLDDSFLEPLSKLNVDYVIWFAPFKLLNTTTGEVELPKVCIFDVELLNLQIKNKKEVTKKYNEKVIISAEI